MKPYNILFIIADQLRKDTLGCYGNDKIQTPNIDSLAKEGMSFSRAYCDSPICMPSRSTIHTGKKALHHGAKYFKQSLRADERTMIDELVEHGYMSNCIGSVGLSCDLHRGRAESIADWRDGIYEHWNGPYYGYQTADFVLGHSNPLVGHYGNWLRDNHPEEIHHFIVENMEELDVSSGQGVYKSDIPEHVHSSSYVGEQTVRFLEKMKGSDKPFFCMASFPDPHWPIIIPQKYHEMYDHVDIPPNTQYPEAEKDNYPRQFKILRNRGRNPYDGGGHYISDPADTDKITRAYWGSVSLIDHNVGKMLRSLQQLGMDKDTIVIFTTDHGEYMGAHECMTKGGFVWEELINVPYIMRCPGLIPQGVNTDALFSFIDIAPTLLDMVGVEPVGLAPDGISFKDVLSGAKPTLRNKLTVTHFAQVTPDSYPDIHSLVTAKWKLNYYAGDPNGELYNLLEDPKELFNLYNDPAVEEIQRKLIAQLLDELIQVKDTSYIHQIKNANDYGGHVMRYEKWKPEFDQLEKVVESKRM